MKRISTLAVVLVVVLTAGCLAVEAPGDTDTNAVSGVDSRTITEQSVTNTSVLVGAHTAALRENSFTTTQTRTIVGEEYRVVLNQTWKINSESSIRGLLNRTVSVSGDPPDGFNIPEFVEYRDGSTAYRYLHSGDKPEYREIGLLNTSVNLNPAMQRPLLSVSSDFTNASVETVTRDGTQLYRISTSLPDTEIQTNRSIELLVSQNGVVRQVETQREITGAGGERLFTTRAEISDIGETVVEQPDWYESAVEETEDE
jgi:hypothetical protein